MNYPNIKSISTIYIKIYLNAYGKTHYTKKITKSIKDFLPKSKIIGIKNTSVNRALNQYLIED